MHPHSIRRSGRAALPWVAFAIIAVTAPGNLDGQPVRGRVGIYDSRVISYAWFWSDAGTRKRDELIATAKSAKSAGNSEQITQANDALATFQARSHLQMFSTAPAEEALAALAPKLPEILKQAGVSCLVSKWDDDAMRAVEEAERVDLTDVLAAALFTPDERQRKVFADIRRHAPVPLDEARKLLAAGKL